MEWTKWATPSTRKGRVRCQDGNSGKSHYDSILGIPKNKTDAKKLNDQIKIFA